MSKSHNKKRNTGIIFEQLVQYVADATVDKRLKDAKKGVEIIRQHFKPGSELYREFRLFNALVKTRVKHSGLATRILGEARGAIKKINRVKLRMQKSLLIKDINHTLDENGFYYRRVDDYKNYATIQTLMNDWRKDTDGDIGRIAKFENQVCEWLLRENDISDLIQEGNNIHGDPLAFKLFLQKFNIKYEKGMNKGQIDILNDYVFSSNTVDESIQLTKRLDKLKKNVIENLEGYRYDCKNEVLQEKFESVIEKILKFDSGNISDESISQALMLENLRQEILGESNE